MIVAAVIVGLAAVGAALRITYHNGYHKGYVAATRDANAALKSALPAAINTAVAGERARAEAELAAVRERNRELVEALERVSRRAQAMEADLAARRVRAARVIEESKDAIDDDVHGDCVLPDSLLQSISDANRKLLSAD